jgi:hypothetical protein
MSKLLKSQTPIQRNRPLKISGLSLAIATAALALAIGLLARFWLVEKPAEAANLEIAPAPVSASVPQNAEAGGLSSSGEGESSQVVLSQIANDLQVTVSNIRREGEQAKADVCFEMPDSSDWALWHTTSLRYGDVESPLGGGKLLEHTPPGEAGSRGRHCDEIYFHNIPASAESPEFTLTIHLGAYPTEGGICAFYLGDVQSTLDVRGSGIRIACSYEEWGANITIADRPAGMSLEEAEQIAFNDEFFVLPEPWVFTFQLEE